METLAGKNVFVVGAGSSGMAAAFLLLREGAVVTLLDERPKPDVERSLGTVIPASIAFDRGRMGEGEAARADLVVLSPGVPREKLPGESLRRKNAPVWGELELAYRYFRGSVTAVTGTNGKSTVTTLVGEMASRGFPGVFVGGNLGTPFSAAAGAPYDWGVVEASSFQLETIDTFRPKVAVLLNLTEDHSDRYRDFDAYADVKMAVFRNQGPSDAAVFNADDPEVSRRVANIRAEKVPFSLTKRLSEGVCLEGDEMVYRGGGKEERYPRALLKIRGAQNVENAMAAIAAARRMGVSPNAVREVLASFPGLPHRVEFVRQVRGVSWFNDSKGTNVGAVLKCLEGFSEPVVLIAGGKDKGIDFLPLREPLRRKARAAVLFGQARGRMSKELGGAAPLSCVESLDEAVRLADTLARPGDVAILSPACSSFDQFRNFEERGEAFRKAVRELPA
ncbi:MAG: UDP-N-acetylmuramoyl-L-alanine--D-glutamate ligase [Deltaproteobacteria bacterium]|nr:UDP-N-acetylmuramoyl-L-alanine--D-glutamate ligase [Deltaproteobacteria bacterium]